MVIRAVFFDMGGTIETYWHTTELRLKAMPDIKACLRSAGIETGLDDHELFRSISAGYGRYHEWSIKTMEELQPQQVWSDYILKPFAIDPQKITPVAEDLMYLLESRFFHREMRPEVPSVLETIQKLNLKIGLISNICSQNLVPANLDKYGIRHYFDPIILSSNYRRRKPDPAIFHFAANQAGVPTSECMYVGDRIARDVVGARRAGYGVAIQIVHEFEHGENETGAVPDHKIQKLTELVDILEKDIQDGRSAIKDQKRVHAILFDAGDILYFRPERGQYLRTFLSEINLSNKEISDEKRNNYRDKAFNGEISQREHRQAVLDLYGIHEPGLIERGIQAMEKDDNNIRFFDGVRDTLISLKKEGFLLGIITDTANPIHVKLSWFEQGGFGHVWDSIISSQELGVEKPDPGSYNAALKQLGLCAYQTVFVGHSPEELDGARELGMRTIAFNYGENAKADYYINKFSELLKVPILH